MKLYSADTHVVEPQVGMVLLLCLLFLIALTLLGLTASADAILQHQLAANLRESERAKQTAISALSWAEDWLLNLEGAAPEPCVTPCESFKLHSMGQLLPHPELEDLSWWQTQANEAGVDPLTGERLVAFTAESVSPPMWIVEVAHEIPAAVDGSTNARTWYRIPVRASGQTDSTISVIESTVSRPWSSAESSGTVDKGRVSWRQLR